MIRYRVSKTYRIETNQGWEDIKKPNMVEIFETETDAIALRYFRHTYKGNMSVFKRMFASSDEADTYMLETFPKDKDMPIRYMESGIFYKE